MSVVPGVVDFRSDKVYTESTKGRVQTRTG